jgi:hypothetical protein
VTEPSSLPWRPATRFGSRRPFGPVTLSSITACFTCRPAPTANANWPSFNAPVSSAMATVTLSGITTAASLVAAAAVFV